jgi:hypothetical protein
MTHSHERLTTNLYMKVRFVQYVRKLYRIVLFVVFFNKMANKKYHTLGTVRTPIAKSYRKKGKLDTLTH